ncbi:MAG: deoxyribonuclease IV [Bradymonadales bacterium]|nr:deoxyribonuclease IV [Bradymonadales bacterium]
MLLGAHMSIAGGVSKAIERARSIGCTAMQIFTSSARGWKAQPIGDEEARRFRDLAHQFGPRAILVHDNYLINLAATNEGNHARSVEAFVGEIERCDLLDAPFLVMHPGSAMEATRKEGMAKIARSLNGILDRLPDSRVTILLETTAGQGTNLGYRFEELRDILDQLDRPDRFGICLDTCHVYAAGYEITTPHGYQQTFEELDRLIGLDRLKGFHLNDSKNGLGSRVDRHEEIGRGAMGLEPFRMLLNDARFSNIPMSIETPKEKATDLEPDARNLEILRSLVR